MGLFNFNSKKKNKNVELESQTLDSILNTLAQRTEPEAVTKQRIKAWIGHRIDETSKLINQDSRLLEKTIFQDWAKLNDISPDVSYARSFEALSLEQFDSLQKYAFGECKKLESKIAEKNAGNKVDSSNPTKNQEVTDEENNNNNNEDEIDKELNAKSEKNSQDISPRSELEKATKQKIQVNISNRILKASKLINQNWQLLEKAIFQEWAEKNNISSDKSYESSYTNLSLDQFSSLEKYIFDKCEKLESQKLNNSKEKTLPEDEQKEQTQNEQQNTDNKVDSSIPTKNPIVPNKNNINEETTKIDLNEIYKELNTTEAELYLQWMKNDSISSHDWKEYEKWVIKYYNYKVEEENRQKKLNEIYKELNTTEEELRFKWFNEVCEPIVRRGYGDCMKFEDWVIEYYNNYKDNLEKKPRSR